MGELCFLLVILGKELSLLTVSVSRASAVFLGSDFEEGGVDCNCMSEGDEQKCFREAFYWGNRL